MPLRQFLNSGAKQLIFHPWDLYPGGKLKQILTFEVVSPIPVVSPGAVVTVAAEQHQRSRRTGSLQAGALQQHRGVSGC